jgi:ATP-dependent exoDNAse (exonuclease V) beta subunit
LWLERIAVDGPGPWSADAIRPLSGRFARQLSAQGIPGDRLKQSVAAVQACLVNTLGCERGRWLLTKHQDAQSELAVNGLIDGTLVRATIDRTFIDEAGLRWVVDYKTSSPAHNGQDRDTFLLEEKNRYQDQLQVYLALIRKLYPGQPARAALYFPTCQGWVVLDG